MKKIFVSLLFVFLFASISQAQWWVDGGNLIWPYGDVSVPNGKLSAKIIDARGPTWDYDHQRLHNGNYEIVYWVDGTNGNDSNDGKTNATAYKTLAKVVEKLPTDLENSTSYILLVAGSTITLTNNLTFNTKNGTVIFVWVGAWIDSVSSSDADPNGLWLNPDSSSHKLVSNSNQVLINTHGYKLTLIGGSSIMYAFHTFDWRKNYAPNSHRHYYNRIAFYTDVPQTEMFSVKDCNFDNYSTWGMEIRMKNITQNAVVFYKVHGGFLNGFKIVGDVNFTARNDWAGAIAFANNDLAFKVDRAWEPSGYYHPDYANPFGELRNWDIEAMGERQLFAFEDTNFGPFNFWWMDYTQGAIPETGLPFIWINWHGLSGNTITYLSTKMAIGTDRCLDMHILHNRLTDKVFQYFNGNLKQDADTLKVNKYLNLNAIPKDSTGLSKGMLYFNSTTGAIHRKF